MDELIFDKIKGAYYGYLLADIKTLYDEKEDDIIATKLSDDCYQMLLLLSSLRNKSNYSILKILKSLFYKKKFEFSSYKDFAYDKALIENTNHISYLSLMRTLPIALFYKDNIDVVNFTHAQTRLVGIIQVDFVVNSLYAMSIKLLLAGHKIEGIYNKAYNVLRNIYKTDGSYLFMLEFVNTKINENNFIYTMSALKSYKKHLEKYNCDEHNYSDYIKGITNSHVALLVGSALGAYYGFSGIKDVKHINLLTENEDIKNMFSDFCKERDRFD